MSATSSVRAAFMGSDGHELAARLDLPAGPIRGFALFAHCFTCTKDVLAAKRIAGGLAAAGIGVLRFDFTGLGSSEGDFANTNFSSNVNDLVHAANYLRQAYAAPAVLIGHSLGGAAVLAAAADIPEVKAIVTIGAPADVAHVLHQFGSSLAEIKANGEATVTLVGRPFRIKQSFVDNAEEHRLEASIKTLGKALLVMHSPTDTIVGIENASRIFQAAKHPKSFVALDGADHLVSSAEAAAFAAQMIVAWTSRYLPVVSQTETDTAQVLVRETGLGTYQNVVVAGRHRLLADEPTAVGGLDTGPSPYDYLSMALGACTAMTLRVYAEHKNLNLGRISVRVDHGKVAADHCADCGAAAEGRSGKIDRFARVISVEGEVDPALRDRLVQIAGKCPVHRTLEASSVVVTHIADA